MKHEVYTVILLELAVEQEGDLNICEIVTQVKSKYIEDSELIENWNKVLKTVPEGYYSHTIRIIYNNTSRIKINEYLSEKNYINFHSTAHDKK